MVEYASKLRTRTKDVSVQVVLIWLLQDRRDMGSTRVGAGAGSRDSDFLGGRSAKVIISTHPAIARPEAYLISIDRLD